MLDVGCGSGILAVAALLLGAKSAVGVDIDEMAVKTAKENAQLNGVKDKLTVLAGNLTEKLRANIMWLRQILLLTPLLCFQRI